MNRPLSPWKNLAWLFPVVLFLIATLSNLELPGIQDDEVYYVPPAAALLKQQYDTDYVQIDPSVIHLFGRPFPLMFNYYTSFLRTYLTLPVFALGGINVATIRGSAIFLDALALLFFMAFTQRLTQRAAIAMVSGIFLALDASFVAYAHNDAVALALMMALKGIGLWALLRWWQQPPSTRGTFLYLGAFAMGLGITDRASFLWLPMALAPTLLLVCGKNRLQELFVRLRPGRRWIFALAAFAAGASVFIAFNLATLGGTFSPMASAFDNTTGGADNLDFFGNLHLRLRMLTDVLGGGYLQHFILGEISYQTRAWHFEGSPLSWLVPLAFAYFAGRSTLHFITRTRPDRPVLLLLSMTFWIFLFTCFTPTLHRGHQLLMLYPFPHILVALFLFDVVALLRQTWLRRFVRSETWLVAGLVVLIGAAAAPAIFAYHRMLQQTGGRGVWSEANYEIVAEADRHPERTIVCMDWGFNANLLAFTKQPVRALRNYANTRRSHQELAQLFDSSHVFLLHAPEYTYIPGAREEFFAALKLGKGRVDTLRVFHQREGQPVAYLVHVRRQDAASNE